MKGSWQKNERKGIIFLGNEYAALQIEKSGENDFALSYLESGGSEAGDAERSEKILWKKNFTCGKEKITLKMKFRSAKDGKSGLVRFFAKYGKLSFKSKPFSTSNAHWVGGRYGWF